MKTKFRKSIMTKMLLIVFISMLLTILSVNFITINIARLFQNFFLKLAKRNTPYTDTIIVILFLIYISSILLVFITIFLSLTNRRLKYLKYIIDTVDGIKTNTYLPKLELKGNDEFTELAQNINTMSDTIEYRFKKEQEIEQSKYELITAVSHDLKTPLTSVIGYLELLKDGTYKDEEDRAKYTETAYNKSLRLRKLINELFEYTKLNGNDLIISREKINISMLLNQMVGESILTFDSKNIKVKLENNYETLICEADCHLISRVFENIIGNAEKYALPNSVFKICLNKDEHNNAVMVFENQCSNIEISDENKIFDKFYRVDKSRNSSIEGSGLGLSIAKRIVEMHGGTISVRINKNKINFTVSLPLI